MPNQTAAVALTEEQADEMQNVTSPDEAVRLMTTAIQQLVSRGLPSNADIQSFSMRMDSLSERLATMEVRRTTRASFDEVRDAVHEMAMNSNLMAQAFQTAISMGQTHLITTNTMRRALESSDASDLRDLYARMFRQTPFLQQINSTCENHMTEAVSRLEFGDGPLRSIMDRFVAAFNDLISGSVARRVIVSQANMVFEEQRSSLMSSVREVVEEHVFEVIVGSTEFTAAVSRSVDAMWADQRLALKAELKAEILAELGIAGASPTPVPETTSETATETPAEEATEEVPAPEQEEAPSEEGSTESPPRRGRR